MRSARSNRQYRAVRSTAAAVVAVLALALAGCGGDDDAAAPAADEDATTEQDTPTGDDTPDDTSDDMDDTGSMDDMQSEEEDMADDDMDMGDDGADDGHEYAFGQPADPADADRTVEVTTHDDLSYDPVETAVSAGETVTFVVTNAGEAVHEFVIGDEEAQQQHEQEMQEMMESGEMMMHDDANAITLQPGETKEITWHFESVDGGLEYACHEPGHYAGGMVGSFVSG